MLIGRHANGEIETEDDRVLIITDRQLAALKTIDRPGVYHLGRIEIRIVPEGVVERTDVEASPIKSGLRGRP